MKKYILLSVFAVILLGYVLLPYLTMGSVNVTINKLERVNATYLVFTDKGVFENTDTIYFFKFNSSNLYGDLKIGSTYSCTKTGYRFNLTSTYPNLVSCK